jgi:hypothetical protein
MPKKQTRQITKTTAEAKPAASTFATSGQVFSTDFNPDYTHVISDLKRIAIMAASFTVVLVALAFIIK